MAGSGGKSGRGNSKVCSSLSWRIEDTKEKTRRRSTGSRESRQALARLFRVSSAIRTTAVVTIVPAIYGPGKTCLLTCTVTPVKDLCAECLGTRPAGKYCVQH